MNSILTVKWLLSMLNLILSGSSLWRPQSFPTPGAAPSQDTYNCPVITYRLSIQTQWPLENEKERQREHRGYISSVFYDPEALSDERPKPALSSRSWVQFARTIWVCCPEPPPLKTEPISPSKPPTSITPQDLGM